LIEEALEVSFDDFVRTTGERVRRALVAYYGVEIGTDAAAEAMRVAWERWPDLSAMENPGGYLFRVGQSHARSNVRWARHRTTFPSAVTNHVHRGTRRLREILEVTPCP
jgi:RNA polymerase sigma-70 factor (ECF subfamily)